MKSFLYLKISQLLKSKDNFIFDALNCQFFNQIMNTIKKNILIILDIVFFKLKNQNKILDYNNIINHFGGIINEIINSMINYY